MDKIKEIFKNFKITKANQIYATPIKRLGSFIIDSLIIIILFNGTVGILSYYGFQTQFRKQEIITKNKETENEKLEIQESIDKKIFTKMYYIFIIISSAYFTIFLSSRKQATIGNQMFKIMVVHTKKAKIGPLTAFIRYISVIINNKLFGIGYLTYFFREDKAFLQDILSETRVINLKEK